MQITQTNSQLRDAINYYSAQGCYIIALAYREIFYGEQFGSDLCAFRSLKEGDTRAELESGCEILSLLVFRNELRPDTRQAV